jgi:hypothetical protein
MADVPSDTVAAANRRRLPFDAPPDVRMRELAGGAWEIDGSMTHEQIHHERVRSKAYEMWDQAGRPPGQDLDFWLAAEAWAAEVDEADTPR